MVQRSRVIGLAITLCLFVGSIVGAYYGGRNSVSNDSEPTDQLTAENITIFQNFPFTGNSNSNLTNKSDETKIPPKDFGVIVGDDGVFHSCQQLATSSIFALKTYDLQGYGPTEAEKANSSSRAVWDARRFSTESALLHTINYHGGRIDYYKPWSDFRFTAASPREVDEEMSCIKKHVQHSPQFSDAVEEYLHKAQSCCGEGPFTGELQAEAQVLERIMWNDTNIEFGRVTKHTPREDRYHVEGSWKGSIWERARPCLPQWYGSCVPRTGSGGEEEWKRARMDELERERDGYTSACDSSTMEGCDPSIPCSQSSNRSNILTTGGDLPGTPTRTPEEAKRCCSCQYAQYANTSKSWDGWAKCSEDSWFTLEWERLMPNMASSSNHEFASCRLQGDCWNSKDYDYTYSSGQGWNTYKPTWFRILGALFRMMPNNVHGQSCVELTSSP